MLRFVPDLEPLNHVCVHGHFYQPPRENPFTGVVEDQPGAGAPYANWNERITAECYEANIDVPVRDDNRDVVQTITTYEWISHDFGPTLLEWLQEHAPDTYREVIAADARSAVRFGGHGSAMAQAYNHTILPLSNARDRVTQVRWGIADFERRYGRRPEGMWLPETAVDLASLEVLADAGIAFTVLSPYQAASVRDERGEWIDVVGGRIDTRIPYLVELPDGREIAVYFYNGPLSQEIAFNGILEDGKALAKALAYGVGEPASHPLLSHVATDGETYGHHHRHGEMALAAAIARLAEDPAVTITNYAEFLTRRPPTAVARIVEASSWSCAHGVERWRSDCGCSTGQHPDWHQAWRGPLRTALDWLRDAVLPDFEGLEGAVFDDAWAVRDAYIEVVLGDSADDFVARHALAGADDGARAMASGLLAMQHHAMLMYTSCGWFFDDISGLEAVFVLRHAGKVLDLAEEVLGRDLEPEFLRLLSAAPSNVDALTGADVYAREVAPYRTRVAR
jgi:alpha-amylase/alpha-mannosidase (GH57 family)